MNWDKEKTKDLKNGDTLIWKHSKYNQLIKKYPKEKLLKEVTIKMINQELIKTNFGSYSLETGKNIFQACGCMRFCDCYGYLTTSKTQC